MGSEGNSQIPTIIFYFLSKKIIKQLLILQLLNMFEEIKSQLEDSQKILKVVVTAEDQLIESNQQLKNDNEEVRASTSEEKLWCGQKEIMQ